MKKYYVFHQGLDTYIEAEEAHLTNGGDLIFTVANKFVASFHREKWDFFKEVEIEKV